MVSSIGSYATDIMQQYTNFSTGTDALKTAQSPNFDELIGNGTVTSSDEASTANSSTGITSMGGSSSSEESSSSSNSEMDLNNDGVVTIDEIMQYTAMKMAEQMQDQLASDEGADQMGQQNESSQQKSDINDFKTQMAAKAYQAGQGLLTASIASVTQSFVL